MKRPYDQYMSSQTRNGIASSLIVTPTEIIWSSVTEFLLARFPHLDPDALTRKIEQGRVYYDDGTPVPVDAPLIPHQRFWYFREIENEPAIPFEYEVLFEDDNILVIDKPHFLSTTPVGRSLKETVTTRLRKRTGNMAITPAHRLDRATAGVLLLTKKPELRRAYQDLFEYRKAEKTYHALCHANPALAAEFSVRLHLQPNRQDIFVSVVDAPPNSHTDVRRLRTVGPYQLYELKPSSGRKHQLRCQMAHLGAGIVNDIWYPEPQPDSPDDFSRPLQLLARSLAFTDPVSGQYLSFTSRRELSMVSAPDSV